MGEDDYNEAGSAYGRRVGERLRAIRRQKRLSLQDVEATSDHEFKASVLGAYERGEGPSRCRVSNDCLSSTTFPSINFCLEPPWLASPQEPSI